MIGRIFLACMIFVLIPAGPAGAAASGSDVPPPKYGPAGAPHAAPLWQSHGYLQTARNPAPDFWKLITHYVGQESSLSCSVAAVTMVLNAISRTREDLRASDANVQQAGVIEKVKAAHWKERVTAGGWNGRVGLTLAELEEAVRGALVAYGIRGWTTTLRSFPAADAGALAELRAILAANEASADDFVLLHFLQDKLTADPGGPYAHISPVGAYDAASDRVLVLDVDREYYGPYWVGLERLLIALDTSTPAYGRGGLLILRRTAR